MTGDNRINKNIMALFCCIVISLLLLPLPCFVFLVFFSHDSHDHHFLSVVVKVTRSRAVGSILMMIHIQYISYVSLLFLFLDLPFCFCCSCDMWIVEGYNHG
ncbi:hypothetical protein F5888DRAFT_1136393 [Russula emetica]|nr:hypothetical protein F5888DRAFT_1136393 [Russula emetica]